MATTQDALVEVTALLVKEGVFKPDRISKAMAGLTGGNPYKTDPTRINEDTVSKIRGAIEKIEPDPKKQLEHMKAVGLHSIMHPNAEVLMGELKNSLDSIGRQANGKGIAELVQERVAAAAKPILSAADNARRETQEARAENQMRLAEGNSHRVPTRNDVAIARAESGKGQVADDSCLGTLTPGRTPPGASSNRSASCSR